MSQIRQFASMLVVAAVGCSALRMLLPQGALQPVLRVILSMFFLLLLLAPLRHLSLPGYDPQAFYERVIPGSEQLTGTLSGQLEGALQSSLTGVIEGRLKKLGIEGADVRININTNAGERIDISGVEVLLGAGDAAQAQKVRDYIANELELPCTVAVDGEVQEDGN